MRLSTLIVFAGSAVARVSRPARDDRHRDHDLDFPSVDGFNKAKVHRSKGGNAVCVSGFVPVTASTDKNLKLDIPLPKNQTQVTEFWVESFTAGSTFAEDIVEGKASVEGTWDVYSTLCVPAHGDRPEGVQILTHGVGFDQSYWDFGPDYSYVDIAAEHGYATFLYDRLGVGLSDKPDPIQVIQAPIEVEIANVLATSLRDGKFSKSNFSKVIGVGHSFGSIITQAITQQYPKTLDAAILTGFTTDVSNQPTFLQALNLALANENQPARFSSLNNGFLVSSTAISLQIGFFKAPNFDPKVLYKAEATKGTVTFGELNSLSGVGGPAKDYNKPVAVVNGANDHPFCAGNCTYPVDLSAAVKPKLYPNLDDGKFGTYLAPVTGHGLNFHYSANEAFEYVQKFLEEHELAGK